MRNFLPFIFMKYEVKFLNSRNWANDGASQTPNNNSFVLTRNIFEFVALILTY